MVFRGELGEGGPSISIRGRSASGSPDGSIVFMKVMWGVTMHAPNFGLRDRLSERVVEVPFMGWRSGF